MNPPQSEAAKPQEKSPHHYANGRVPRLGDHVVHTETKQHSQITSLSNRKFSALIHEEDFTE